MWYDGLSDQGDLHTPYDPDEGVVAPVSYKAEVIADNTGTWASNALRFGTQEEAQAYASDLFGRWMLVRETRVVPADEPVNAEWANGRLQYFPSTLTKN